MNHPPQVLSQLKQLGENLKLARIRREESTEAFANRLGITRPTLAALENGSPSVAIGTYAMALWAIGMTDDLGEVAHPDRDIQGKLAERELHPERIRDSATDNERYNF